MKSLFGYSNLEPSTTTPAILFLEIIFLKSLILLYLKGITVFFKDLGTPKGFNPGSKCSFNFSLPFKFVAKYQSCHP